MPLALPPGPRMVGAGGPAVGGVRVYWDYRKVSYITESLPAEAFGAAAEAAAAAAAARIGHEGPLAQDVRRVKSAGALYRGAALSLRAQIGSNLPYAAIEHFGGWITAKNTDVYGRRLLYIRPYAVQATKAQVYHRGKRYLDAVPPVFIAAFPAAMRAGFPS